MDFNATNEDLAVTNVDHGELHEGESSLGEAKEIYENIEETCEINNLLSNSNEVAAGGDADSVDSASVNDRPRRNAKPSTKCIENKIQDEHAKLEREWCKVQKNITLLQNAPSSIEEIPKAIAQVRAAYNIYESTFHQFANFLTNVGTGECLDERSKLDAITGNNKQLVLDNIEQGNRRKQELMLEVKSSRSGTRSHASSASSTALRAKARAEAAAARKKAELHKRRSLAESQSALAIQREELALAKRKLEEQARLEALRLEEDAAIAQAKVNAIDEELGLGVGEDLAPIDLPSEDPQSRVQQFVDSQPLPTDQIQPTGTNELPNESRIVEDSQPRLPNSPPYPPNPTVGPFIPRRDLNTAKPDQNAAQSCLEYMARREILAKKVEKFDDNPEHFHTWKVSFKNMLKDVRITPQEELALLTEYTNNESKKLVQRLHNAYIQNPSKGVEQTWTKLGERFGSNVVLTKAHLDKLINFPKISYRDHKKLQEFGDLLLGLQCTRDDGQLMGLRILDESIFLRPVVTKLPTDIQNRWQRHAFRYKTVWNVDYPPFSEFSKFVQDVALERNDPNLMIERQGNDDPPAPRTSHPRQAFKTDMTESIPDTENVGRTEYDPNMCPLHGKRHTLAACRAFRAKPIDERKNLVRRHRLCFRCLQSASHFAKDCKTPVKCSECGSDKHLAALHVGGPPKPSNPEAGHGGERNQNQPGDTETPQEDVNAKCTEICGDKSGGRSCAKICLAHIFSQDQPERKVKAYVVVDEQSNRTLAKPELFDLLGKKGNKHPYTLKTCAGTTRTEGRHANDLVIETPDGLRRYSLPTVTECAALPDNKEEIPTPAIAKSHPHLREIAKYISEVDENVNTLLLIGRDAPQLHKVRESRNGRGDAPWAQRLDLGWVILGNACLDGVHQPSKITAFKTNVLPTIHDSIFEPCRNKIEVKTAPFEPDQDPRDGTVKRKELFVHGRFDDGLGANVFQQTDEDNTPGLSVEDRRFNDKMNAGVRKNEAGNWIAPLPLRGDVKQLPDSRNEALKRLKSTKKTLDRKPEMRDHYFTFMQKILDSGHAERVPPDELQTPKPKWYLPHFGVYHPQKPTKIRVVFDSASEVDGTSLNKLLLSGPDLTNSLIGVLMRFRRHPTAFMADIEQMFHSFLVEPEHRDLLRFLWFDGNNPDGEVVEYRMNVHLFGNTSSPAVATFCLRKTAQEEESQFGSDARKFVEEDFYVDDGLKSLPEPDESIDLLKRTQSMLATANLRLHKIASNNVEVTRAFPSSDRAPEARNLDLNEATNQVQRSLGVYWNLQSDSFSFKVAEENKPFTRRGVLSTINSLFDPLGIAAPVTVKGKTLLRCMSSHLKCNHPGEWDQPIPDEFRPAWMEWRQSLAALQEVQVPRCYNATNKAAKTELHVFCDASERGIAAVCYQRSINVDGVVHVSFVFGKAKLAPAHATTIPRLELCAAVLAAEITQLIQQEKVFLPSSITYYSDSKVVLGYITNESRRFYVYVSNRVEIIRRLTTPKDWRYVPTHLNPADRGTRSMKTTDLATSSWLTGPKFLVDREEPAVQEDDQAIDDAEDPEVRPVVKTFATEKLSNHVLESNRFTRFSRWSGVIDGLARLISKAQSLQRPIQPDGSNSEKSDARNQSSLVELHKRAEVLAVKGMQHEAFAKERELVAKQRPLARKSPLAKLNPIIDENGLLRVGGRLNQANLTRDERHPIIIPGSHHLTSLLVKHCHQQVKHQGRHFTRGQVRARGYWIVGEKRLVNRVIHACIQCKRLRGKNVQQKMADLPAQRTTPAPPFSHVGVDVFGPWQVLARRTRGGVAQSKRWAVMFTCLTVRAIHIEIIEAMDTSSFINALRRFFAVRGPVSRFYSDCGTNFVGAQGELRAAFGEMDKNRIELYMAQQGCEWVFNPPHASHMGGVWERMIGIARRIIDAMLQELPTKQLTHEALTTLMAEVSAIVNNRPLTPVPNDPEAPDILTPAMILTQKTLPLPPPPGRFTPDDLHTAQWRQVQYLANVFWARWKKEFLPLLQTRRKWVNEQPNLRVGDLVLLKNQELYRNDWPRGLVTKVFPGDDGKVRKIEVTTARDDTKRTYIRPVTEVVLLITADELNKEQ